MNASRDQRWILRSRALLDQSVRDVDVDTLRRLNQMRWSVLKTQRRRRPAALRWVAAAAVLVAVLAIARFGLPLVSAPHGASTVATDPAPLDVAAAEAAPNVPVSADEVVLSLPAADLELLQQESDHALLEELEFYAWLEAAGHEG